MGLTKLAIKIAVKVPKIESFNRYLFIGPHPDDIEIGAGASISKLISLGKEVTYVICTDGRYGKENISKITCEELIQLRHEETLKAANYIGVKDVIFLDFSDGNQYEYNDLLKGLASVINKVQPDIIFAPDPDVTSECHQDHLNAGKAAKELAMFASFPEILAHYLKENEKVNEGTFIQAIAFYMTAKPNRFVKTGKHYQKMLNSIFDYHLSQYPKDSDVSKSLKLYLKLRNIEYGLPRFTIHCDGFRVLGKTHMHCLPEMGN